MNSPASRGLPAIAVATLLLLPVACRRPAAGPVRIVASTTLIATIVNTVGGPAFSVTTIAPAGHCPGHFDIRPSDVLSTNEARLLLNHGWEEWFPRLEQSIDNLQLRRVTLLTKGNWMVPPLQTQAAEEITALLLDLAPERADSLRAALDRYKVRVDSAGAVVRATLARKTLPPAIAADKQAPFLQWAGFRVVATYGRAEDFTAGELNRLARIAVDSGVGIIVDNLQSGPDAGRLLADELKVGHVTLTNFPLDGDYVKALLDNAAALVHALP
jgi:zinc transport system substrate-binding protein